MTCGGRAAEEPGERGSAGLRWGLCDGVLLYLLGGDEKQLPSPLLFPALSSSYPTLSFSKTLLFHPLSACLAASPGAPAALPQAEVAADH